MGVIGGPRTGQTYQHGCRAVRGEGSAGCVKRTSVCGAGRSTVERGGYEGQRGSQRSRAASAGSQLVKRDVADLDQVRQRGQMNLVLCSGGRAINNSHMPSMCYALQGLLSIQHSIPSAGLPGTEPAAINYMLYHANVSTYIHMCTYMRCLQVFIVYVMYDICLYPYMLLADVDRAGFCLHLVCSLVVLGYV